MNQGDDPIQKHLDGLIEISRFYGMNEEYVIAGGGNTSFKNKGNLWIKASGISLAEIDDKDFVCLSRDKLKLVSAKSYSQNSRIRESQVKEDLNKAILSSTSKRPSVETSLHEIIDFPYVVHTHPTLVNALMCSKRAKRLSRKLFGKQVILVEYTDPGYVLFKKVESEIINYREIFNSEPAVIFLQNHGVFVSGNTLDEIKHIYADIEEKLQSLIEQPLPINKSHPSLEYAKKYSRNIATQLELDPNQILFRTSTLIKHFVLDENNFKKVDKPFTPDDIVYCKSDYLFVSEDIIELKKKAEAFQKQKGFFPKIIAIKGKGLLAIDDNEKSASTVMDVFENMMKVSCLSENFGGPQFMTPEQIDFIDNWEVENYRRQVSK